MNCPVCNADVEPNGWVATHKGYMCANCGSNMPRVCDFCSSEDISWRHPAGAFVMTALEDGPYDEHKIRSQGEWAACQECHDFIEAHDHPGLLERSLKEFIPLGVESPEAARQRISGMHMAFFKHAKGTPYRNIEKVRRMPGNTDYMRALEQRADWLRYAAWRSTDPKERLRDVYDMYRQVLERGDTFFMDPYFCRLVDHARRNMPDDIKFERTWIMRERGWMWLAEPFDVPRLDVADPKLANIRLHIDAVGWMPLDNGGTWFCCFEKYRGRPTGFGPWSYFQLHDGDPVSARVSKFEDMAERSDGDISGAYAFRRSMSAEKDMHEIRWVYAAMHLMSQRLTARVRHSADRPTRKRILGPDYKRVPIPNIEVITLRRLQADRDRDPKGKHVDWQWQWEVPGHWHQYWYGSGTAKYLKSIFVDDYWKGPLDKPMKPSGKKIFVAAR